MMNHSLIRLFMVLVSATLSTFLLLNIYERRLEEKRRKQRESIFRQGPAPGAGRVKRSEGSFALREKKSGLTWGGGNIKASEAARGTKRKFLGK